MKKSVYILGLNFAYHELAACLLKDGKLLAAVEEERFSRIKRGKKALVDNPDCIPEKAIQYCLDVAGISLKDIDHIGFSFYPENRLKNIGSDKYFIEDNWGSEKGEKLFYEKIKKVPSLLSKFAGFDLTEKIIWIPHHVCHASSAFFPSPFKESAVLSIDGIGEFSSTWLGYGKGSAIHVIKEIGYPNSTGFLWEKFSTYLGFTEYDASKVMGLGAYGDPNRFYKTFQKIVTLHAGGEFRVDGDVMRFRVDDFTQLEKLFGIERIDSPAKIRKDHEDIASGLQKITDDVVLHLAKFLKRETGSEHISLAGGVALNCVSNATVMNSGLFKEVYVQPAANDAGTALGAAFQIWNGLLGGERVFTMDHTYWGPGYSEKEILAAVKQAKVSYHKAKNIAQETAKKLAEGNIIGWFQGRVEWGPRALGNRTLLGDPRRSDMKMILNERIKRREPFRPFAPSVLSEHASKWFATNQRCKSLSTQFMTINFNVKKDKRSKIPAVTHVDGTSRVQMVNKKTNPAYYKMINSFYKLTGVPLVLNTSFNDNEPIVCSPADAINTFLRTKMDYLAIGDYLVSKEQSLLGKNKDAQSYGADPLIAAGIFDRSRS